MGLIWHNLKFYEDPRKGCKLRVKKSAKQHKWPLHWPLYKSGSNEVHEGSKLFIFGDLVSKRKLTQAYLRQISGLSQANLRHMKVTSSTLFAAPSALWHFYHGCLTGHCGQEVKISVCVVLIWLLIAQKGNIIGGSSKMTLCCHFQRAP